MMTWFSDPRFSNCSAKPPISRKDSSGYGFTRARWPGGLGFSECRDLLEGQGFASVDVREGADGGRQAGGFAEEGEFEEAIAQGRVLADVDAGCSAGEFVIPN